MAARKGTRKSDSTITRIKDAQLSQVIVEPPEGVNFRCPEERAIFDQIVLARPVDTWREFDLIVLARIARIEFDLRDYGERLDAEGPILDHPIRGSYKNPLIDVMATLESKQQSYCRLLSLGTKDGRDLNKHGASAAKGQKADNPKAALIPLK